MKGIKYTTDTFKERADEVHNTIYDYSKSIYIGSEVKLEIICAHHGSFFQTPHSHLQGKGCPVCGKLKMVETNTKGTDDFKKRASEKHNNFFNYDKTVYVNANKKVIITCPIHGDFEQLAIAHLSGNNCGKCANIQQAKNITKTQEKYMESVVEVHGDTYLYDKTVYTDSRNKVIITCKIHGDFEQKARSHLQGQGCPKCGYESNYSRSNYIKKAKGRICTFYTLRCWDNTEEFYKIGITVYTVEKRYSWCESMPYEYEIVSETKGSAGFIWDLERDEKRKLKELKYLPKIDFHGSKSECFTNYKLEE